MSSCSRKVVAGSTMSPIAQIAPVAGEDRTDARLVEDARLGIDNVVALDQRAIEAIETAAIGVERAAALILPRPRYRRQAARGEKLRRAVARAREAVAEAQVAALGAAVT